MLFDRIVVRGVRGSILLHPYGTAATLREWTITRAAPHAPCVLTARVAAVNWVVIRQRPLHLIAPRRGGFWRWPVAEMRQVTDSHLVAALGPPEM